MGEKEKKELEQSFEEAVEALSTDRQRLFVREYLVDLCGGAAAKRAGYSEKCAYTQGWENLRKPDIHKAVKLGLEAMAEQTHIHKAWVIKELKENYRRCVNKGDRQAANRALDLIGKSLGMFEKDVNLKVTGLSDAKVVLHYPDNGRGPKGIKNDEPKGSV